jgi:hypothetical protein
MMMSLLHHNLVDGTVYDYHIVMVIASVIVMIIVNVYKNLA